MYSTKFISIYNLFTKFYIQHSFIDKCGPRLVCKKKCTGPYYEQGSPVGDCPVSISVDDDQPIVKVSSLLFLSGWGVFGIRYVIV